MFELLSWWFGGVFVMLKLCYGCLLLINVMGFDVGIVFVVCYLDIVFVMSLVGFDVECVIDVLFVYIVCVKVVVVVCGCMICMLFNLFVICCEMVVEVCVYCDVIVVYVDEGSFYCFDSDVYVWCGGFE